MTRDAAVGTCYGFEVHSKLPFVFLREGRGTPLRVTETTARSGLQGDPVQRWPEIPRKRLRIRLYARKSGFTILIGKSHVFAIDNPGGADRGQCRIRVSKTRWAQAREILLWTTPAAVTIAARGDLPLHASSVDVGGAAVLIAGDTGAGKTTTAAAFANAGHRVLSDDLSCCRTQSTPVVLPGPALLRIDPVAAQRVLQLKPTTDQRRHAKLAFALPTASRGSGDAVPLRAICLLRANTDGASPRRLSPVDAIRQLWPSAFHLPGDEYRSRTFQHLADLIGRVPVWEVARARDWAALPATVDRIAGFVHQ